MFLPGRHARLARSLRLPRSNLPTLHQRLPFSTTVTRLHTSSATQDISDVSQDSSRNGQVANSTNEPLSEKRTAASSSSGKSPGLGGNKLFKTKGLGKRTSKLDTILGQNRDSPIRARFAPSPTGDLHLGSLRTALFNKLCAQGSNGGAFILRVEDTDQSRLVEGAEKRLMKDLEWAGLSWDEGPDRGGPYGPYRQSERLDIYKEHVQKLIDTNKAYRCFCSPERLQAQREEASSLGQSTNYPRTCRHISPAESAERAQRGETHTVRFKSSDTVDKAHMHIDAVYGRFKKSDPEEDYIIMKSDGFPTYHLANVVDDHLMRITHVIRGEEWLISTPKHMALYDAFGWTPPTFAHLGLLVKPDGNKLSKRDNSGNLNSYKEKYFPIPLLRWLSTLGASFHNNSDPRTFEELLKNFRFKFTTGSIKLHYGKLRAFQDAYAAQLVMAPETSRTELENGLFMEYLIQPLRQLVLEATHNKAASSADSWEFANSVWKESERPLQLVPALASADEASQEAYLRRVILPDRGVYENPTMLVSAHPYLFWRPPRELYRQNLLSRPESFDHMLDVLENNVLKTNDIWEREGASSDDVGMLAMESITAALAGASPQGNELHTVLRLLLVGGVKDRSMTTKRILGMLGRDEIKARIALVRDVIQEQAAK